MTRAQVLYVGGWGRSGSTLLSHMLAQVAGHVSVGELRYVWQAGVAGRALRLRPALCRMRLLAGRRRPRVRGLGRG